MPDPLHPYQLRLMVAKAAATLPRGDARIHTLKQPRSLSGTYAKDRWSPSCTTANFAEPEEVGPRDRPTLGEARRNPSS